MNISHSSLLPQKAPRSSGTRGDGDEDPFESFVSMENLLDKLKLLDYEATFCGAEKLKPLPRCECELQYH